jgi:selenide,water dikinase
VSATIIASKVPVLSQEVFDLIDQDCIPGGSRDNRKSADEVVDWGDASESVRTLLTDAQTSGGLLLCVRPKHLHKVLEILKRKRIGASSIVGSIKRRATALMWIT